MLRKLFTMIILLNDLPYDVKFKSVCMADDFENTIKKYTAKVESYVNYRTTVIKQRIDEGLGLIESGIKKMTDTVRQPDLSQMMPTLLPSDMNAAQMITSQGYRPETHYVLTADGYMLTMHRILTNSVNKQAVILHHGLLGSSEDWLILGRDQALPYLLSDYGYDVWLLNARGNKYSRLHSNQFIDDFHFWDFSWHDIGMYDLPATLTYISEYTNFADLYFVGHSMGATALLVLLSTRPEYNNMLKTAVLLAPLAFMHHSKGPLKYFNQLRRGEEVMPDKAFSQAVIDKFCRGNSRSCANPLLLIADGGKELFDTDIMDRILNHVPAGGSTKTLIHYIQLLQSNNFRMYNYGIAHNYAIYKQNQPPSYNLEAINVSISLFTSPDDWLANHDDIMTLLLHLRTVKTHFVVEKKNFSHLDFIWSKESLELLFNSIIKIIINNEYFA
ncbi:lipase 3-like [Anticarsia gemmatalis]|uniref:lipase 3-like n=1 Tax=Anticarsia gemmatalis TaxID=129554 RepID=UPI003F774E55